MIHVKRNQLMRWIWSREKEISDACGGSGMASVD
ncbi:hypothetical protein AALP_AAs64068U000200 [Arabis alpina]|uniref:Uncharacterized protein n=1 Tax=Arabis alpina TaxID=50452 RepID=A0A087G1U2_ARAAL|nr:hypothetical protein AALP_AAs64068U000200 [Arabis alpina]